MKSIVRRELERERYAVFEEPPLPPGDKVSWLSWSSYRPDLLGIRSEGGREEIVLVECETHPNMRRLKAKNSGSVFLQPRLFGSGSVRRILAVPHGRLGAVNMKIRDVWEIWMVGSKSLMEKFPVV